MNRTVYCDNPEEKPADLLFEDWTIEGIANTRHAIDLTCPLSDSSWSSLTVADEAARANTMGVAGLAREEFKRTKVGDHTSQLLRDNDLTMRAFRLVVVSRAFIFGRLGLREMAFQPFLLRSFLTTSVTLLLKSKG